MTRRTHILLLLLLAISLPVRGYAAATMLLCVQSHHGNASASMHETGMAHADHADAQHEDGMRHDHAEDHPRHGASPGAGDTKTSAGCGLCGSCCSSAALAATMPAVSGDKPASSVVSLTDTSIASFVADLLSPPPNRLSA